MKFDESDVLAYVEDRLSDADKSAFLEAVRNNEELAEQVKHMRNSMLPIEEAYRRRQSPPVPESLRHSVNALVNAQHAHHKPLRTRVKTSSGAWSNNTGLVACVVAGLCVGALATMLYTQKIGQGLPPVAQVDSSSKQGSSNYDHERLVQRIADYQSLYIESTVANVSESRLDDAQQLLASIATKVGMQTGIPDFSAFGYEFARAQELGFEGSTLVQLVYRKPGSSPLAFCYMQGEELAAQEVKLKRHHQLNAASWIEDGHHYVLLADETNKVLQQMHDAALAVF